MPQVPNNIPGWTLGELVEETKGKLHLKGRPVFSGFYVLEFDGRGFKEKKKALTITMLDKVFSNTENEYNAPRQSEQSEKFGVALIVAEKQQ